MGMYSIVGRNKLSGEIKVQGSKNAVLPVLAATILNKGRTFLYNCPKIVDVYNMIKILEAIGCKVVWMDDVLLIDSSDLVTDEIPENYVQTMRSSIIVLGAMLGRLGSVTISFPGGCSIGVRPIDLHIQALKHLNIDIKESNGFLRCETVGIKGSNIYLDYPSVGATENIMLAAVLSTGITRIYNAAKEPEIIELQNYLNASGAKVAGAGTESVVIEGVKTLNDVHYHIMPDRIVAGTYLIAAAMTQGEILLKNVEERGISSICSKLVEIGCEIDADPRNGLLLKSKKSMNSIDLIRTQPYPGFPTDMQAQMMTCLTISNGTSVMSETIFESRFKHVPELKKMGADIIIEGHLAIIKGVECLHGAEVFAEDLRGGASLILAGLAAEGKTIVRNAHFVQRGYEMIECLLKELGADIQYIQ